MQGTDTRSRGRRALLLFAPAAIAARLLPAQQSQNPDPDGDSLNRPGLRRYEGPPRDMRLPSGRLQRDEILKANYEKNVREARDLIDMAKSFGEDLEKDKRFVLSLNSLKKLDNMENLIHRIRDRMKAL